MLTLVALALVADPAWPTDTKLKPVAKPLAVAGAAAPVDVVLMPPKKKAALTITGPATVTVTLIGLVDKKAAKPGAAGAVDVKLDKERAQKVTLAAPPTAWTIDKKPRVTALTPQVVELNLGNGPHTIALVPRPAGKVGYGLIVSVKRNDAPVAAASPQAAEPPAAEPPAAEAPPGVEEPALAGGDAEPDIMGGPNTVPEPAPLGAEGYTFVGSPPPLTTLTGPKGSEQLLKLSISEGLEIAAIGPGRMLFDIHAHRDPAQAESLKPLIVGVMVDDVLIQTLAVDQAASSELVASGESYKPSERVILRVPVEAGSHRVRLTLSDSAVIGASVRPRFEALSGTEEPSVLSAEVVRSEDLKAAAPLPEVYGSAGVGIGGAAWMPTAFPGVGTMAELDVNLQIPVAGPRLAAGLWAGYGRVDYNHNYADDRRTSGVSRSRLELTTIPVLLEVRWSAPIAAPFGLEAGVGGGVILARAVGRSAGGVSDPGIKALGAGVLQASGLYELGPGALLLKLQLVASQPMKSDVVRSFDVGGAIASLGYRFTFGKNDAP